MKDWINCRNCQQWSYQVQSFARQIPKSHWRWLDAACVGASTPEVFQWEAFTPLAIKSMGYGKRQVVGTDKFGFPKGQPKKHPLHSFRTGGVVEAKVLVGKSQYAGHHISRILGTPLERSRVVIKYKGNGKNFPCALTYVTGKLFNADGCDYGFLKAPAPRFWLTENGCRSPSYSWAGRLFRMGVLLALDQSQRL